LYCIVVYFFEKVMDPTEQIGLGPMTYEFTIYNNII